MCGIAGFTQRAAADPSSRESLIRRMTATIVHRGPDQRGAYCSPNVALGAVRLQVIDLDGGEQPIRSGIDGDGEQCVIVYNGEIYNFRELRGELESLGHRFRSDCDTEVALRAFLEWDTGCFARFRGMFAMALWSERDRRLVLARDRLGVKPLYIRRLGEDLVFGSELKVLFEHPAVPRRLDRLALSDFLSLLYVPAPRTLVEGIEKLPSGHFLEWRDGVSKITPYWTLRFAPDLSITEDDARAELDRLLRESVREHLVSDVPLGVWSSGGIDSSTLLHYSAELGASPIKTFSMVFESKSCDESPYFREIARVYGTEHHEFELHRDSEIVSAIEDFAFYSDEPGGDAGALPVWFLSKMSRQNVTVALSGEGGDELFGGYLTYRADALALWLRAVPPIFREMALSAAHAALPASDAKIGFEYKLKRGLEGSLLHPDEAHLFWNGAFSEAQKTAVVPGLPPHDLRRLAKGLPSAREIGFLNRYLLLDQHYYLQDNLLCKVDRMSMAHSLEVRPPLLDHRIVEFAARLPEKLKIDGGRKKVILKSLMRDKLPQSVLNRPKAGLDIPAHEWFRGPLLPLFEETMSEKAVRGTGIFHYEGIRDLAANHRSRRINAGYQLWALLTVFLWLKRWKIETS
ncbi:MAG TPA: asparagine synthase (glutamine-hydrolyzing) [Bryobacteraceae bacterium]|nr:asparagine synthase (glutamine-hydrolyzing) [Bryobacteraceae bacterium]